MLKGRRKLEAAETKRCIFVLVPVHPLTKEDMLKLPFDRTVVGGKVVY